MKNRYPAVLIIITLLLFSFTMPLFAAAAKKITVKGAVLDPKGKPVAGAAVYPILFYSETSDIKPIQTGKDGSFVFTGDAESLSDTVFIVKAKNYSLGNTNYLDRSEKITIRLENDVKRKGKVLDDSGNPIADATVSIKIDTPYNFFSLLSDKLQEILAVKTKADGTFVLEHIPDFKDKDGDIESMRLFVKKKGKAYAIIPFDKNGWISKSEIILSPECLLSGRIYLPDKKGAAPAGTIISIAPEDGDNSATRTTKTDKLGNFRFEGLATGTHSIRLGISDSMGFSPFSERQESDWAMTPVKVEISPDKPSSINLTLQQASKVSGKVVDKVTGKPVRLMDIQIHHAGLPEDEYEDVYAEDDGSFEAKVAPGEVRLKVMDTDIDTYDDIEVYSMTFDVAEGQNKSDIDIKADFPSRAADIARSGTVPEDFSLIPGTYQLQWDPDLDVSNVTNTNSRLQGQQAFAKINKLPELASKKAMCELFALDGGAYNGYVAVVIDESKGTGKGYDRAYIDLNRNWDLTDDTPIELNTNDKYDRNSTGWISLNARQGLSNRKHYSNQLLLQFDPCTSCNKIHSQRKGAWKGTLESSKGKIECVIIDKNSNGIYSDPTAWPEKGEPLFTGDTMYIDANGAGKVFISRRSNQDFALQNVIQIGKQLYKATVSDTGDSISIQPYNDSTAQINVTATINGKNLTALSATARGMAGEFKSFSVDKKAQSLTVPSGVYRIKQCTFLASAGKQTAALTCETDVKVSALKETNNVEIGGKIFGVINPDTDKLVWKSGKTESLDWQIKLGENTTITGINIHLGEPIVKFYDASGKMAAQAKGGYT